MATYDYGLDLTPLNGSAFYNKQAAISADATKQESNGIPT